jgi:hypothetical protein
MFMLLAGGALAIVIVYLQVPLSGPTIWFLGFTLGFFSTGHFFASGAIFDGNYNFGRGVGALFLLGGYTCTLRESGRRHYYLFNRRLCSRHHRVFFPETTNSELK